MLVLTPTAVAVVNNLTTAKSQPDGAGLRISSDTTPVQDGLHVAMQADKIDASLTDGVLTVRAPKSEAAKPRHIKVSGS